MKMKILRRALVCLIFIPALFALLVGYLENGKFLVAAAAAAFLFLAALEFLILKRKTSPLTRAAIAAFVGILSVSSANLAKNCSHITYREGLRPVLLYGGANGAPSAPELRDPYDLVLTGGEHREVFVTHESGKNSLARIPLENPAAYKTRYVPTAHCIVYIPETNQVVVPGFNNQRITFVNASTLKVEKIVFSKNRKFIGLDYDETLKKIYLVSEKNALTIIDPRGDAVGAAPLDFPSPFLRPAGLPYAVRASAPLNRLFITSWVSGFVYSIPLDDFGGRRHAFYPPSVTGLAVDAAGRRLFVASYLRSWILELDPDTLALRRRIPAGFGTRALEYAPGRDLLLAANDFDGTVDVIDLKTGARRSYFVGPRARGLVWDAANEKAYACSLCGVFEISP